MKMMAVASERAQRVHVIREIPALDSSPKKNKSVKLLKCILL